MNSEASENSRTTANQKITNQLYEAASSARWRPGQRPLAHVLPISVTLASQEVEIQRLLARATRKNYVRAIKPLRPILRNQAAVNDSLIKALERLDVQSEQIVGLLGEVQKRVAELEHRLQQLRR